MSKCRRKAKKGKSINLSALGISASDRVHVGLDVHKRSTHVGVLINNNPVKTFVIPPNPSRVIEFLRPLEAGLFRIVYEAGPTGYGLARAFQEIGWRIEVIAPGKIDRPANRGSKSDRLDCIELAQLSKEKDKLKKVEIPTVQEEQDRQIIRLRAQIKKKEKRVKQQIKSLLLQYGIDAPPGLSRWSQAGIKALAELEVSPDLRFVLNSFLTELECLIKERKKTEKRIKEKSAEERFAKNKAILESHPGVGLLTTMGFLTEVYQPDRFKEDTQVALYLGLAPGVKQSGDRRIAKPLLKAGQGPLRCLLIQAAWAWVGSDPRASKVYGRLVRNTGCKQKAIVGVARRLAINLWWMLLRGEEYRSAA